MTPRAGCRSFALKENFPFAQSAGENFFIAVIPSLIDSISPPPPHHRRSTPSAGEKQLHPLAPPHSPLGCGEKVCGGATRRVFLPAGCESPRWRGDRGGEEDAARAAGATRGLCLAAGAGDLSNRAEPLWILQSGRPAGGKRSLASGAVTPACGWMQQRWRW